MRKAASKALYLFLCSILGIVLFAMLHRAIFVLYDLLLLIDANTYSFGLSSATLQAVDFFALILALFLGGWYGTMMGLEWYAMVYGPNAEHPAGLFHGFIPHHWRGPKNRKPAAKMQAPAIHTPTTTSTTVKVPVKPAREWTFDDLIPPKPAAKKKSVAKRSTRKVAVKK